MRYSSIEKLVWLRFGIQMWSNFKYVDVDITITFVKHFILDNPKHPLITYRARNNWKLCIQMDCKQLRLSNIPFSCSKIIFWNLCQGFIGLFYAYHCFQHTFDLKSKSPFLNKCTRLCWPSKWHASKNGMACASNALRWLIQSQRKHEKIQHWQRLFFVNLWNGLVFDVFNHFAIVFVSLRIYHESKTQSHVIMGIISENL